MSKKVREIVSKYVQKRQKELLKNLTILKEVKEAAEVFKNLNLKDWIDFTKKIKWNFSDISSNDEFVQTIEKINTLLLSSQFPMQKENLDAIFGILYKEVSIKASQQEPDERKLTISKLEKLLLSSGTKDDKWYSEIYEAWKPVQKIDTFLIGEFFEILSATRYCRRNKYLSSHDGDWFRLLDFYINKLAIPNELKKKAIYEYLWLKFRPIDYHSVPEGDLTGEEIFIKDYFNDFSDFKSASELEDAQSLLFIVFSAIAYGKVKLTLDEWEKWLHQYYETLNDRCTGNSNPNPNQICHLNELFISYYLFMSSKYDQDEIVKKIEEHGKNIWNYIDSANLYDVTLLGGRLNRYIKLYISDSPDKNHKLIEALEKLSQKFDGVIQKREGNYKSAKTFVERGAAYLKNDNPKLILRALNYFHKAKDLWYQEETVEGYVLGLINIAQLYSALGMNLAAKYYAICGAWASSNHGDENLLKRISDSFGLLFHADFKQGSWMNALHDFYYYIKSLYEFNPPKSEVDIEDMYFKTIFDFAAILYSMNKFSPQFETFVNSKIQETGKFKDEIVNPIIEKLAVDFSDKTKLKEYLKSRLTDNPFNDIGKERTIRFKALGILWKIVFSNDYLSNSIGEEFCAILQILLVEIALSDLDFHLIKGDIVIELKIDDKVLPPTQLPSNQQYKWKVYINEFDSADPKEINFNTAKISTSLRYLLNEISLLKEVEFGNLFEQLFKDFDLATKTLSVNSYQRMYRSIFKEDGFNNFQRQFFNKVNCSLGLPSDNDIMKWKDGLSYKYDKEIALEHIRNRFKNTKKNIYLTIEKLKQDNQFSLLVNDLRKKGWLDWQIILVIMNFVVNYKANQEFSPDPTKTESENIESYQKTFNKYIKMEEKDCYVYFPTEALKSDEFMIHFSKIFVDVLKSFGLENKSRFPNFSAIKEFLDIRFNMKNDNTNEGNPLSDV